MKQKGLPVPQAGLAPIVIVILIALTLGGYLIYTQLPKFTTPQPTPIPSSTPLPSVTSVKDTETVYTEATRSANWKTYTTDEFIFKYPLEWVIKSINNGVVIGVRKQNRFQELLSVRVSDLTIEEEIKFATVANEGRIISRDEIMIDNIKGIKFVSRQPGISKTYAGGQYSEQADIILAKNNNIIKIIAVTKNTEYPEAEKVPQILSTFRFLP